MNRPSLFPSLAVLALCMLPVAQSAPSASTAKPAGSAAPASAARPVPGSRAPQPPRRVPGAPLPGKVDTTPVRVNGNLVVARTRDGRPVPVLQPVVRINTGGGVPTGLHDPGSPAHLAVCPSCRSMADKETLQHLNAWLVGERSRRMNEQLNRIYAPPPPPSHRKKAKKRR